jgi:hypothetical protein
MGNNSIEQGALTSLSFMHFLRKNTPFCLLNRPGCRAYINECVFGLEKAIRTFFYQLTNHLVIIISLFFLAISSLGLSGLLSDDEYVI